MTMAKLRLSVERFVGLRLEILCLAMAMISLSK